MLRTLRHSFVRAGYAEGLKTPGYACLVATATLLFFVASAAAQEENVPLRERVLNAASPVSVMPSSHEVVSGVSVDDFKAERNGNFMEVNMRLNLSNLKVKRNRAVLLTPCVINPDDSLHLRSIGVYGRRHYFYYLRTNGEEMLSGADELSFRTKDMPSLLEYHETVPYEEWMDGADFQLHRYLYGCCNEVIESETGLLGHYARFVPEFLYVTPEAEVKTRSLEGSAYIDFVVNKTNIDPNYRRNPTELKKINITIDSVRGDKDVTIDNIWLKGYASPEGSYAHNTELSIGRVNALKDYVCRLYDFPASRITTENEPEDWAGLRRYVEASSLEHRAEILALIDTDLEPDAKEAQIKKTYPTEYKHLLEDCYPALRHTDYRVNYTVRGYSDVEEIKEVLRTQPQKLSLNEMYLVAQTLEPGSDEFVEVFQTAVRLYPDDPTANLNAANVEMKHGEFTAAERYLAKAGSSPEAEYARGVEAYLRDDIASARQHLTAASEAGLAQAAQLLEQLP